MNQPQYQPQQNPNHQPQQNPNAPQPPVQYQQPPVKKSGGCSRVLAIGLVCFFGFTTVMCGFAMYQGAKEEEQRRIATEQADEEIRASIDRAREMYDAGELEDAVRELERASRNQVGSTNARTEASRLLDEYGAEYGQRFEQEVAALIDEARQAMRDGVSGDAQRKLKDAVAFQYAPNHDDATALLRLVTEAASETRLSEVIGALNEAELSAFIEDGTLPAHSYYEDQDVNALFLAQLDLRRSTARKLWSDYQEAERERRERAEKVERERLERKVKDGDFGEKAEVLEYAAFLQRNDPVEYVSNGTRVYHWLNLSINERGVEVRNRSWLKLFDEGDDGDIQGFQMFISGDDGTGIAASVIFFAQLVCKVGGLDRNAQARVGPELQDWMTTNMAQATKEPLVKKFGWLDVKYMVANDGGEIGFLLLCGSTSGAE